MTNAAAKAKLLGIINDTQGCKAVDLTTWWCLQSWSSEELRMDITSLLTELVAEKKVVKVTYVLKNTPYREKAIYLPEGTEVHVTGA